MRRPVTRLREPSQAGASANHSAGAAATTIVTVAAAEFRIDNGAGDDFRRYPGLQRRSGALRGRMLFIGPRQYPLAIIAHRGPQ